MVLYLGNQENKEKFDRFQRNLDNARINHILKNTPEDPTDIMMSLQRRMDEIITIEDKNGVDVFEKYPWVVRFSFYNYTLSKT